MAEIAGALEAIRGELVSMQICFILCFIGLLAVIVIIRASEGGRK